MSAKFPYRYDEQLQVFRPTADVRIVFGDSQALQLTTPIDSTSTVSFLPVRLFENFRHPDGSRIIDLPEDEEDGYKLAALEAKDVKIEFLLPNGEAAYTIEMNFWRVLLTPDNTIALGKDITSKAVYTFVEGVVNPYFTIEDFDQHLYGQQKQENVTTREFNFPPEVRTPCEQYLQYFGEFLRDIGITATTNLEHDAAGKVLFSVKPNNPRIALDKIREALQVYLELAGSPISDITDDESDPRVLMLRSEINTLKSRLDLAQIKAIEQEKRLELQDRLIQKQEEIDSLKDSNRRSLQPYNKAQFKPEVLRESAVDAEIIEGEIVEETQITLSEKDGQKSGEIKDGDVDLKLMKIKPANIGAGLELNTPRLIRHGVRSIKQFFDWADKFLNEE
jgi:hypothetical protein